MNKIDEIFGNFLPKVAINRIILEKRGGIFLAEEDPHIQSSREKSQSLQEPGTFHLTYNIKSYEKQVGKSNSLFINSELSQFIKIGIVPMTEIPEDLYINKKQYFEQAKNSRRNKNNFFTINSFDSSSLTIKNGVNYEVKNYSRTIFFPNEEPKNLILLYCAFLDIPAEYASRYPSLKTSIYSDIKIETIIRDGIVKSETDVFLLEENSQVWNEKVVSQINNGEQKYYTDEPTPRKLVKYQTKNYKLQDFRVRSKLDKMFLEFENNNQLLLNLKRKQNITRKKAEKHFSEINISKNNLGASLSFFLRNIEMIKTRSFLSTIYDLDSLSNSSILEDIYQNTRIISFKILRRRVELLPSQGNSDITDENNKYIYRATELEEVLLSTKEEGGKLISRSNFKETKNVFSDFSKNYRSFNYIDRNLLKQKTDGFYQYGVEIEVKDGSIDIVLSDIQKLNSLISKIQEYYNESLIKEINKITPNFNKIRQTDDFISQSVNLYFDILLKYYVFSGSQIELESIKKSIKNQVSIIVEDNIRGVLNYIKLLETLASNLSSIISHESFVFDDPHIEGEEGNIVKNSKNIFVIKEYFDNDYVDCNFREKRRLKYLPTKNTIFFNEFTVKQFAEFMKTQKSAKFLGNYSVLSPRSIQEIKSYTEPENEIQNRFSEIFDVVIEKKIPAIPDTVKKAFNPGGSATQIYGRLGVSQSDDPNNTKTKDTKEIQNFYSYCSKKISPRKIGKEIEEISMQEQIFDFIVQPQYLYSSLNRNEEWKKIENLIANIGNIEQQGSETKIVFDDDRYIMFRFKPLGDHRSQNMKISNDLIYLDLFFFVKIDSLENLKLFLDTIQQILNKNILPGPVSIVNQNILSPISSSPIDTPQISQNVSDLVNAGSFRG